MPAGHSDSNADCDTNGIAHPVANAHPHGHADTYGDGDADANTNSDADGDTNADADTHALKSTCDLARRDSGARQSPFGLGSPDPACVRLLKNWSVVCG